MKILTADQTRAADAYTIKHEPILSIDLMERAAQQCVDWVTEKYNKTQPVAIFCGVGNNGGDGLVIARKLVELEFEVELFIIEFTRNYSSDFQINLGRLKPFKIEQYILTSDNYNFTLKENVIVIDAIFGSGLTRPIEGYVGDVIDGINEQANEIISIDIPSGLFCDNNDKNTLEHIIKANYTLTFQQPKLVMLLPAYGKYVGDFEVLDIGLSRVFLNGVSSNYQYVTQDLICSLVKERTKFSHKGTYGHALLIAGSTGKMGAEILAARACLRTGAGLLTVQLPSKGLDIMQTAVPEAMCVLDESENIISTSIDVSSYQSIGVGPGLGKAQQTAQVLKLLIQNTNKPIVIDADALNILSENLTWLAFLPAESVLTPHPKEFERLFGKWSSDEERLNIQIEASKKFNVIIVLKGANTSIAFPDGMIYFNSTGNPGMATAGSGDVLTGIITGFVAQGYNARNAALFGVYLHGLAGDIGKQKNGVNSLIASDIIASIPQAFNLIKI